MASYTVNPDAVAHAERLIRAGQIACVHRASPWRHKEVELAVHDLLQLLDRTSA